MDDIGRVTKNKTFSPGKIRKEKNTTTSNIYKFKQFGLLRLYVKNQNQEIL